MYRIGVLSGPHATAISLMANWSERFFSWIYCSASKAAFDIEIGDVTAGVETSSTINWAGTGSGIFTGLQADIERRIASVKSGRIFFC